MEATNLEHDPFFNCYGIPQFISMPAQQAIRQHYNVYESKLEQLVETTVLTLRKTKELVDELKKAVNIYKQPSRDFARLVDYEDNKWVNTIRLLSFLLEHKKEYILSKSFNENLSLLFETDTLTVTVDENKEYLKGMLESHKSGVLISYIEDGIAFFDKIFANEMKKV